MLLPLPALAALAGGASPPSLSARWRSSIPSRFEPHIEAGINIPLLRLVLHNRTHIAAGSSDARALPRADRAHALELTHKSCVGDRPRPPSRGGGSSDGGPARPGPRRGAPCCGAVAAALALEERYVPRRGGRGPDPVSKVNLARRGEGSAGSGGRGLVSFPWLTVRFLGLAVDVEVAADVPVG